MTAPTPGWYPNPDGTNSVRYWDGQQWTAVAPNSATQPTPTAPAKKAGSKLWKGLGIAFVALGVIVVAAMAFGESDKPAPSTASSAASADPTLLDQNSYREISDRDWSLIVKDPDSHKGERVIVYGTVTQFDAATGTDSFRADVGADVNGLNSTNTVWRGNADDLSGVVEGDKVKIYAVVDSTISYDNAMGGKLMVPQLTAGIVNVTD